MNKIEKEKHLNSALIAKQNIIDDLNEKDNLLSFAFNPFDNEFIGLIVSRKNYDYFITNKGVEVLKKDIHYIVRSYNIIRNEPKLFVKFSDTRKFNEELSPDEAIDIYNKALKEKINFEELKTLCLEQFEKYLDLLFSIIDNELIPLYKGDSGLYLVMMERNFQYVSLNSTSLIEFFETKSIIEDIDFNKIISYLKTKPTQLENKI